MILTVTLNVALDRTVAVPRIALGNRHRAVDSRTAAGGKGVNVARALKSLGEPVHRDRPGRRADRRADPRAARRRAGPARLHRGRRRLPHQPLDRRPDLRRADRDQRARPAGHRRRPRALLRAAALPRPRRRLLRDRRLAAAGRRDLRLRRADRRACAELGVPTLLDTDGEPMRAGLRAQPAVVAPNVAEAEEAVGYEFTDAEDLAAGLAGLIDMGAEQAIVTTGSGLRRDHRRPALAARASRRRSSRSRRSPASAPATPSSPATCARAGRAVPIRPASPTGSPAAPSRPSTSAPGCSTPTEVGRLVDRVSVSRLDAPVAQPRRRPAICARGAARARRPGPPTIARSASAETEGSRTSWKSRSDGVRRPVVPTGSTTSRSCRRGGRATPTTSTSPGTSVPTGSSCRCSPRRWTASSARRPPR